MGNQGGWGLNIIRTERRSVEYKKETEEDEGQEMEGNTE